MCYRDNLKPTLCVGDCKSEDSLAKLAAHARSTILFIDGWLVVSVQSCRSGFLLLVLATTGVKRGFIRAQRPVESRGRSDTRMTESEVCSSPKQKTFSAR